MACPERLSLWTREVSRAFAHLSKPQVWGLVLWSAGIAWSGTAGIVQISALLAMVLGQQEQSVFQRLREWYLDAGNKSGKRGKKRRELDVSLCFAPLLRWVLQLWQSEKKQLALVVDATTLGERWTILAISVVLSGCAIPVAWKVLPGKGEGSWRPHWEGLLEQLEGAVPDEWQVVVPAGCGTPSGRAAGIRSCGSIWGSKPGRWERKRLSGSVDGCRRRGRVGRDEWSALQAKRVGSRERCCCIGKWATSPHGSC